MDGKSAFLNGMLEENVNVEQPPGHMKTRNEKKVLKGTIRFETSSKSMEHSYRHIFKENGFKQCPYEHALYVKKNEVRNIVKEVKDYLKKYSSAGQLICRWNTLKDNSIKQNGRTKVLFKNKVYLIRVGERCE
ncbi:retrovirus-related pol polyprotein from transposon TNT 1-94 [Tanacetum coccineum]